MATVVTKNFRIKTGENSFSDPINFLSTSVYLPSGKNLDTYLEETETAISDEQSVRQDADSALGDRIDKEITQRENSISTLQTTVKENTKNINSLKGFLVGENQIEENASPLADQVQNNLSSIQNLQNLIGASSLEEGVLSLLERIVILENEVASLKREDVTEEISFFIDSVEYSTSKDNTWLNYATENGWNCSGEESRVSLSTDNTLEMYDTIEERFVQGQDLIQDKRNYTWADESSM